MKKNSLCFAASLFGVFSLGVFSITTSPREVRSTSSPEKVVFVSSGEVSSFALTSSRGLYAWGDNAAGRLGDGTSTCRLSPVLIPSNSFGNEGVTCISAGGYFSSALTSSGSVYTWGDNNFGQLGDGTLVGKKSPRLISSSSFGDEAVTSLRSGDDFSLAITTTGKLFAWGRNSHGELGDGTTTNKSTPTLLSSINFNGESIAKIAVSSSAPYCFALTSSGSVYGWGSNNFGQLGDGTTTNKSTPTLIPSSSFGEDETVTSICIGGGSSFALTSSGNVYAWGLNVSGQLGDGTTTNKSTPTLIPSSSFGGQTVVSISNYSSSSFALTSSGSVYAYGLNTAGQLGDGTKANQSNPVLLSPSLFGDEPVIAVTVGTYYSLALTSSGSVYAWGKNSHGQLGDGTKTDQLLPERNVSISPDGFFASKLSEYKTCTEFESAYISLSGDYEALTASQKTNLASISLSDYATADDYSSGTKSATVTAADKWASICALYAAAHPNTAVSLQNGDESQIGAAIATLALCAFGCASFFAVRRRRGQK